MNIETARAEQACPQCGERAILMSDGVCLACEREAQGLPRISRVTAARIPADWLAQVSEGDKA